ncbi:disks large-associated protein 5 isoform X1 [Manduca sexta]|uniref:disks large-associated protein 5 isoform X1 n=1 Tax=Manduca sexta TaxID=7130 RepID=UPI00188E913B|nr:disks large-associated protein 5 isoform X1 [Manduca sexta]
MEKSFDFGALLKNHEKKHKNKPSQFVSVAGGVKKRLENSQKLRKSNRLSVFDSIRNLTKSDTLPPVSETRQKAEHRRQQLEKWKEEKEKRKKETEALKKKPFIAGVAHAPLKFVPPPTIPKPMPSTSGRVTRSQTVKNNNKQKTEVKEKSNQSFAPKNATFRPPQNLAKAPNLVPPKTRKDKKNVIIFEPIVPKQVVHKSKDNVKETRAKSEKQIPTERVTRSRQVEPQITKGKIIKANQKQSKSPLKSSSSSELEQICKSPVLKNKSGRKSLPTINSPVIKNKISRKSIGAPRNLTPKNPVPKSESSSEERLRSPKSFDVFTPEHKSNESKISPCVTMSRGKDNARREMKKKLDEGLLDEDTSDIENVDHFRRQLASEIKRMTEMCETWDKISEQTQLPDTVQECVLTAVGQARLLMSQKLCQFGALVERCARPEPGTALVTPADLHGFWDMVFMQVENVDMRFKKLEELRSRGWVEDQPVEIQKKVVKPVAKKTVKPASGPSRLREMIAAARKAKKEQEQQETQPCPEPTPVADGDSKTFEAGFFCVKSPVRSPSMPRTPNNNLLKAVLSSEAKKASASKNSASFAMLRASVMGRNVDLDGIALLPQTPLTPVNLNATPGRSILKSANVTLDKSSRKSIKVVLFDQSDDMNSSLIQEHEKSPKDISFEHQIDEKSTENLHKQHTDSGLSSMDVEKEVENKENSRRKSKLMRQDATEERSPVVTRSRRKSVNTPLETSVEDCKPKRSSRKKALQEDNIIEEKFNQTPKRSTRRRKSSVNSVMA